MMGGGMATMSVLMAHMLNGYLLGILSLVVLGIAIYSKQARLVGIAIVGIAIVGIAFILLAGISGLSFMFSMFSDNLLSFTMALGFIGALAAYFIEMYWLR